MQATTIHKDSIIDKLITRCDAADGGTFFLATLRDGGYAILHHGRIVRSYMGDSAVERAVAAFERLRLGEETQ